MRPALEIESEDFIAVKSFKARGKRISTYEIGEITELEPTRFPEEKEEETSTEATPAEEEPEEETFEAPAPSDDDSADKSSPSLFDFDYE